MTTARDKIAQIINDTIFESYGYNISDPYGAADNILAALPDMIAPLDWEFDEEDCCSTSDDRGFAYEICVDDVLERTSDYTWSARALLGGNVFSAIHLKILGSASFSDAKDACNKHKRDEFRKLLNPPPTITP
jgi:hypothetical protein